MQALSDIRLIKNSTVCMMLSKVKPALVDSESFSSLVKFTPLEVSPLNTFYQQIHSVFGPVLLKGQKWGMNSRLEALISELDSNLASSLRLRSENNKNGYENIDSIQDEHQYWLQESQSSSRTSTQKHRAKAFADALQSVAIEFSNIS